MNTISLFAVALFSVFSQGSLPAPVENTAQAFIIDSRVVHTLSYFNTNLPKHTTHTAHIIALTTKDWKKNREKNIEVLFDDSPIELTVWLFDENETHFRNANRNFERTFPQVSFRFQSFSQPDEYRQALENAIVTSKMPDIMMMSNDWWPTYRRVLSPFPKDLFSQEECHDFFFSFACDAFATRTRIYGVPLFIESPILIVNSQMIADDRITNNNRTDSTWGGFLQNGVNFQKFFSQKASFSALEPSQETDRTLELFQSLVAQGKEKEPISSTSLVETIEVVIKTIDSYPYTTRKRPTTPNKKTLQERFLNGEIATFFGNRSDYFALKDAFLNQEKISISESDIDMYPLPVISVGDENLSVSRAWALSVPVGARYSREAFGYIAYLSHENSVGAFAKDANRTAARRALATPEIFQDIARAAKNPISLSGTFAFETVFTENIMAFLTGKQTASETAQTFLPFFIEQ